MDESTHRKFDIAIRSIAILGTLGVLILGLQKYLDAKQRDYKSHYWAMQLSQCEVGTGFATQIVLDLPESLDREMLDELYKLTYGKFRIYFEDQPLSTIVEIMQRASACEDEYDAELCSHSYFNSRALLFAQQCRDMVSESWNIPLGSIREREKWIFPK